MSCNGCEVCPECYCAARDTFLPMGRSIERGAVLEFLRMALPDSPMTIDAIERGEHIKPAHAKDLGDE